MFYITGWFLKRIGSRTSYRHSQIGIESKYVHTHHSKSRRSCWISLVDPISHQQNQNATAWNGTEIRHLFHLKETILTSQAFLFKKLHKMVEWLIFHRSVFLYNCHKLSVNMLINAKRIEWTKKGAHFINCGHRRCQFEIFFFCSEYPK